MELKFYKLTFLSLCMLNYVQAAIKITNDDISDVIDLCDYTRFDNQLIKLQTGNDILQHNMSNIQKDLDKQKDILSDLERAIKSLPQQIEAMQEKLMENNRQNIEDLKDFKRKEIQMQAAMVPPPVDDKVILIADMRETLKKHDKMLDEIIKNLNDSQTLINEINLEKHTQALTNTISEKLAIIPQIDGKLTAIENSTIPSDMLNDVISNQENIKSLLKEINLEKLTQALQNTISEKLAIMPHIDGKLTAIENRIIPKSMLNDVVSNQENLKSALKEINLEKHTQALKNIISEKLAIMPQIDVKLIAIENRTIPRSMLNEVISNQENLKSLLKEINLEKHTQVLQNIISDQLSIIPQIDGKLSAIKNRTIPRNMLNDVISNQENLKSLLKEINLEKLTQALKNIISDKLAIMPQIDGKLSALENRTIPRSMVNDVISNQENLKSLLKEINLEKHTHALKNIISDKLAIMPQIDGKLSAIENRTIPRSMLNEVISNQENLKSLLKEINLEKHTQALKNIISDKLAIMSQIDGKLSAIENRTILSNMVNNVISNQENLKRLLKEINLEKHTQALKNIISDKLAIMSQIDGKLSAIENRTIPRSMLNEVISNQENLKSLLKEINLEKHTQALKNIISDKLAILPQIDAKLIVIENRTIPRSMLNNVISNQENLKSLVKEINLEKHTQVLKNIISDQLSIIPQIDGKLSAIKNRTIPRNMLNNVISNQENLKSLLKGISIEKHTQALKNIISDKLAIMPQIDLKLNQIQNSTIPKTEHLKFYRDVHQYFHKIDATKICLKDNNQTLTCTSKSYPSSCADFDATICTDNKCPIINYLYGPKPFVVVCNNSVDGGGWMVIQRRINGAVDFYRDWSEYKHGFGDINGEFFIGLEKLHALTSTLQPLELLIQLQDFENVTKYAKYDDFQVGNETENYKLIKLGSYTGDAGNSFSPHVGYSFSTKDRDNDSANSNCAVLYSAAWWYFSCYTSNLNGKYYQHPTKFYNARLESHGINWQSFHGYEYSLKSVQMLIRPRKL